MVTSFQPPVRTLMGPGPSDVHERVTNALARPTIGHLDPEFVRMMDEIKALLQRAMRTKNELTIPISAPGSASMEACFVNLVEPGEKVIVCINGVFGTRMADNVRRVGAELVEVTSDWGQPVDLEGLEAALAAHPDAVMVAAVHAETSTGAASDIATVAQLAKEHGCLSLIDSVTGLGGIELDIDAWGIDALYSGTQKCLSCPPGLSPISMSAAAVDRIRARKTPVQSWFLDLNLVMGYWGGGATRSYHHTAPVNALYGLHEALLMLDEEGLQQSWARHRHHHLALKAGLDALGLDLLVDEAHRLPQLNAVCIPPDIDEAAVRKTLLADHDLEIGAGLGALAGKVWRVGLMGQSARKANVRLFLGAFEAALNTQGYNEHGGVDAADAFYRDQQTAN